MKTLTEINLKRCLSADLSRLGDRQSGGGTLHLQTDVHI